MGKVPSKISANYNANQGFTLKLSRPWRSGSNLHSQNLSIRNAPNATRSFHGWRGNSKGHGNVTVFSLTCLKEPVSDKYWAIPSAVCSNTTFHAKHLPSPQQSQKIKPSTACLPRSSCCIPSSEKVHQAKSHLPWASGNFCSHRSRTTLADFSGQKEHRALLSDIPHSQTWEHWWAIPAPAQAASQADKIRKEMHYVGIFSFWFHSRGRISHCFSASPAFSCLLKQQKQPQEHTFHPQCHVHSRQPWAGAGRAPALLQLTESTENLAIHLGVCFWNISHLYQLATLLHLGALDLFSLKKFIFSSLSMASLSFQLVWSLLPHSLFRLQ